MTYRSLRVIILQFLEQVREHVRVLLVEGTVSLLKHLVKDPLAIGEQILEEACEKKGEKNISNKTFFPR